MVDIQELISYSQKILSEFFNFKRGLIVILDENKTALISEKFTKGKKGETASIKFSTSIINHVIEKRESLLLSKVEEDERFKYKKSILEQKIESALCVPITDKRSVLGIIYLDTPIENEVFTESDLELIHNKMEKELFQCGGGIDRIYYCPHGWDDNCECRKPKAGMFFQAQRDFNLDLSLTFFIGGDERDRQAGNAAGCKTLLVDSDSSLLKVVKEKILSSPSRLFLNQIRL